MRVLARLAHPRTVMGPDRRLATHRQALLTPRLVRQFLILHVIVLVLVRVFRDADDFSDWDLIPFLNANSFASLWQLLQRPEVHFRNPFSFSMNVGAESVLSAVLLRGLGHFSLYWSNVFVLLFYDGLFFALVYGLFSVLFANAFAECVAWSLIAMSPIILTFASTSAFNMQGYSVVVIGLLGCEYFLRKRPILGTVLLGGAFCAMPQGYPLGLFLPYYAICWVMLRAVLAHPRLGTAEAEISSTIGARSVVACVGAVLGLATLVEHWSGRTYAATISPLAPYGPYAQVPPGQWSKLGERTVLFLRQSFVPVYKVDGVAVGFAPYFVYVAVITVAALVLWRQRAGGTVRLTRWIRSSGSSRRLLGVTVAVSAIIFGYLAAFLSKDVKSQRAVFGDLFLVILAAHWISSVRERRLLRPETIVILLALLLCASDSYYLYFTLSVDHSKNHSPVFDFDLSDGVARHDLVAAIDVMREQVENENAALVIYYPDCFNENHTDPAVFFARFLRHFGRYGRRPGLMFPCRWCEVKYGCPFPGVRDRECSAACCYSDPLFKIRSERRAGKRVLLWWWREPREVRDQGRWVLKNEDLASDGPKRLLRRLGHRYAMARIELPQSVAGVGGAGVVAGAGWQCYELVEKVNLPSALPMTIPRTARISPSEGAVAKQVPLSVPLFALPRIPRT